MELKDALLAATIEWDGERTIVIKANKQSCKTILLAILKDVPNWIGFMPASARKMLEDAEKSDFQH